LLSRSNKSETRRETFISTVSESEKKVRKQESKKARRKSAERDFKHEEKRKKKFFCEARKKDLLEIN
jgi:Flp pilus assembly protein TadB